MRQKLTREEAETLAPSLLKNLEVADRVEKGLRAQNDNYAAGAIRNLIDDVKRLVDLPG